MLATTTIVVLCVLYHEVAPQQTTVVTPYSGPCEEILPEATSPELRACKNDEVNLITDVKFDLIINPSNATCGDPSPTEFCTLVSQILHFFLNVPTILHSDRGLRFLVFLL